MTIAVANVSNTDTFGSWLSKTNTLATIVSQNTVTVDTSSAGSLSTGNAYVNGYFGANTLVAYTGIAGGTLATGNTLNLITNTAFTYASSNLVSFNANSIYSNVVITTNSIYIIATGGNTTIGGNYLNINASVTNVTSGTLNATGNTTITGNTILKANSVYNVFAVNGTQIVANTSNTTIVGNVYLSNTLSVVGAVNLQSTANVTGNLGVGGNANVIGNMAVGGSLAVSGSLTYSGTAAGNIVPASSNYYNIGNSSSSWLYGYFNYVISSNISTTGILLLNSIAHKYANTYTFNNSTAAANIDVVLTSSYRSFEYTVQLSDTTVTPTPYYHMTKLIILHDGTTPYITEYQTLFNSVSLGTFDAVISGGNIALQLTPTTANVVAKFIRTSIVP